MATECPTTISEQWIRDRLQLKHPCLGDVRSLSLPGTVEEKIGHLGSSLNNFIRLKSLDLSYNALVSVEGLQHLKKLERLILYHNCIPSLEEVKTLFQLPVLRELDLRLNPLTKNCPHYRAYIVHAVPSLRKLDSCSVRDTERKVAIMQFSSDLPPQQKRCSLNLAEDQRSSSFRLALVDRLTKRLSLSAESQDIVLNRVEADRGDQSETVTDSLSKKREESREEMVQDFTEQKSSTPKQESAKSILRYSPCINDNVASKGLRMNDTPPMKSSTSSKVAERPKVSFGPYVEKHTADRGLPNQKVSFKQIRHEAKGHFTPNPDQSQHHSSSLVNIRPPSPLQPGLNLSDPSNPILHPARLSYSSGSASLQQQQAGRTKRGSYRKPLEMLLNLVDKHWRGERSLHHNNNFLFQAVAREEEHGHEVRKLSAQLEEARRIEGKLNEQLRIVLEENVTLQKQLIKLERQYLKSMIRSSPMTQIREAQTEVEELKKEIEGLRKKVQEAEKIQDLSNMLQESHKSLVATNECLLAELKGSGEHLRSVVSVCNGVDASSCTLTLFIRLP
ncbi:centrosomal protein of 72 kDa isoform X3 [Oryzias melastigma]|uniref:centrosomal protein of 72 kDa isoform X3 n=1 Tax=Oryzias melastigma TaxID=30732 RepID=UPI000CF7F704|nr:centrosomal protein of 72 kDa isoform X3 [Oryzias melastigma]